MANTLTTDIYWASKRPEVRAIHELPFEQRESAASALAQAGDVIDRQIDIWGWDPVLVMQVRDQYGVVFAPAAAFIGVATNPAFIKTSLDAVDYPSFDPAPPSVPQVKPVGVYIGNGIYAATQACFTPSGSLLFVDGQHFIQDGATYIFHAVPFWNMWSVNWTRA